jgi:hypothetical protein
LNSALGDERSFAGRAPDGKDAPLAAIGSGARDADFVVTDARR